MKNFLLSRLTDYLKPQKKWLALGLIGALVSAPLALLGPIFIGRAIDEISLGKMASWEAIFQNLMLLGVTAGISALFHWLMQLANRTLSAQLAQTLRRDAFESVNEAPLSRIDSAAHGDLVSRFVNDADAAAEGVLQGLSQLLPGLVTLTVTLILMLYLNVNLALLVILITPLSIIFSRLVVVRTGKFFVRQSTVQGEMSAFVSEMVGNRAVVRAMGYEKSALERFEKKNHEYYSANFKATLYSSIINPGTRLVNTIVYVAVGLFGALLAIRGDITVGVVTVFLAYANSYTKPFNEVGAVMTQLQSAFAGIERLLELKDWESEPADLSGAVRPERAEGSVSAEELCFSYQPDRPLIRELSFAAKPGQRIALVGPTGCGKTTIINLLMRFYELDGGEICVDGASVSEIARDSLRGMYGMVLQETWLKRATVAENIAYGKPDATREEIIAAAKSAFAHGFVRQLSEGYDTVIGKAGGNLSEGQKQLLCIARIMLAKPDMLILDEATSNIDTRTELLIQQAMDKLMEGHTSFVVAHRLSTIRHADCILVMRDGMVVESGTHEELLKCGGMYAEMLGSQFAQE